MSRKIDLSDPSKLSDADKLYLQNRNRLPAGVEPVQVDAASAGIGAMTKPEPLPVNQPSPVTVETDYSEWNVDRLKSELGSRDLPVSGKKEELVQRLEEDDAKSDEDEEVDDEDEDDEEEDEEGN